MKRIISTRPGHFAPEHHDVEDHELADALAELLRRAGCEVEVVEIRTDGDSEPSTGSQSAEQPSGVVPGARASEGA